MSITKISAAELRENARDLTSDEIAALDRLSDEQVERAALADTDARPATSDMLRRGQRDRAERLAAERLRTLGVRLMEADPTLDLPVWEVTNENGSKVLIKAAAVKKAMQPGATTKVLKLELVDSVSPLRKPERQVS